MHGQDVVIAGKKQHAIGAAIPHLRQCAQRFLRDGDVAFDGGWHMRIALERENARLERAQALLEVRTGELHALLELFRRDLRHRIGRQRSIALERAERGVALDRRRLMERTLRQTA